MTNVYDGGVWGTLSVNGNLTYNYDKKGYYMHIHTDNGRTFQLNTWWLE